MSESNPIHMSAEAVSVAHPLEPFAGMTEPTNPELEAIINLLDGALAPFAEPHLREYAWNFWIHYVPVIRLLVRTMPVLPASVPMELPPPAQLAALVEHVGGALAPNADRRVRFHGWSQWSAIVPTLRALVRSSALPCTDSP